MLGMHLLLNILNDQWSVSCRKKHGGTNEHWIKTKDNIYCLQGQKIMQRKIELSLS